MGANIKRLFGEEFNSLLLLNLITAALTLLQIKGLASRSAGNCYQRKFE